MSRPSQQQGRLPQQIEEQTKSSVGPQQPQGPRAQIPNSPHQQQQRSMQQGQPRRQGPPPQGGNRPPPRPENPNVAPSGSYQTNAAELQQQVRNVLWGMDQQKAPQQNKPPQNPQGPPIVQGQQQRGPPPQQQRPPGQQGNQQPNRGVQQQPQQKIVHVHPQQQIHPQQQPQRQVVQPTQVVRASSQISANNEPSQGYVRAQSASVQAYQQLVHQLRMQLQECTEKYQELVLQSMDNQQAANNLRDLAIEYERLDNQRNQLINTLRGMQQEVNHAQQIEQHLEGMENELRLYKQKLESMEQMLNEKNQQLQEYKQYIQNIAQEHQALAEQRNQLMEEREKMHEYVQAQQKRVFSYQSYMENVTNQNRQFLQMNEKYRLERDNLMQELNRRVMQEKNTANSTYEIEKLNSLLRIKQNEIQQLTTKLTSESVNLASSADSEMRITSLEKRLQLVNNQLEKASMSILAKNKQICELKSLNFQLDKMSRNNVELKSAHFQIEKLSEMLSTKSSQLANLKASYQVLERKQFHLDSSVKEAENLRSSMCDIQNLRQTLHKREVEISKLKQSLSNKQGILADMSVQKEQLKKKISQLEAHIDGDRQESRNRISTIQQRAADLDKKHRLIENQLREKLAHAQSERQTIKSSDQDRLDRIKFLQNQLAEASRCIQHQRAEYFTMRKGYEDKLYVLEGSKSQLESKLSHALYDIQLKENQIVRLQNQIKTLNSDFGQLRSENLGNLNNLNQLRLMLQKSNTQLQNRKIEFQDAMRRATKDNEAYQQTIRLQQSKIEQMHSELSSLRKAPIRDSGFRQQQAVQRQLHELQLQVQHFQQLQMDQNKLADLHKQILVQQNQIENLTRQLEQKKLQQISRSRQTEQNRLKLQNAIIELQRQLKTQQHNVSELRQKLHEQKRQLEQSRIEIRRQQEQKQHRQQQGTQTPVKQHQHVISEPDAPFNAGGGRAATIIKRTDIFLDLRKQNEALKSVVNSYVSKLTQQESAADALNQLKQRVSGFAIRIDGLLKEGLQYNLRNSQNIRPSQGVHRRKHRHTEQLKPSLKRHKSPNRQTVVSLPQGNPLQNMCQQLLEQNDSLRGLCEQYQGRIKQYQNELIKLSQTPSELLKVPITNPFDIRNTIRALEQKVQYFRLKNTEQEDRVTQLLKLNGQLKAELEACRRTSNEKDAQFYKQQFEFSERNIATMQDKLKQALEELNFVRNTQLAKMNQLNAQLTAKLNQAQAQILDLNLKISTSQTEKIYIEDQRKQLNIKLQTTMNEVKRLKAVEREQNNAIKSFPQQLQEIQSQRAYMASRMEHFANQVARLTQQNIQLQASLNLRYQVR